MSGRSYLLTAVLVFICFVMACGSDDPVTGPGPPKIDDNLDFTRQDETPMNTGTDYWFACGAREAGYDDTFVLKVLCFGESLEESFWTLDIVVDDVEMDTSYTFPTGEANPAWFLIVDGSTSNELNSYTQESSGTITFTLLDCGPPLRVDFTVDCTVGSEYWDAPSVDVSGDFSCTVYSTQLPPWL